MNRIRVLQLIPLLQLGGGAEQVVCNLARLIDRSRYEFLLYSLMWGGSFSDDLRAEGFQVGALGKKQGFDPAVIPRIVKLLKQEKIQILHTHLFTANTWGRLASLFSRTPVVVSTVHLVAHFRNSTKRRLVNKALARYTDRIIAVSEAVRQSIIECDGIEPEKVVTVRNGVDPEVFDVEVDVEEMRRSLGVEPDRPVIGVVGRLTPQKGHRYLFDAVPEVARRFPDVAFVLLGGSLDQAEEDRFREDIERRGISRNVIMAGTRSDMPQIYPALDFSLLPSVAEGFSVTVLEAMASGKAVVATRVGGNPEAIEDGKTGYLVPPRDPEALASAVIQLLEKPESISRMGKAARQRLHDEGFTLKDQTRRTESIYEELLKEKGVNG